MLLLLLLTLGYRCWPLLVGRFVFKELPEAGCTEHRTVGKASESN